MLSYKQTIRSSVKNMYSPSTATKTCPEDSSPSHMTNFTRTHYGGKFKAELEKIISEVRESKQINAEGIKNVASNNRSAISYLSELLDKDKDQHRHHRYNNIKGGQDPKLTNERTSKSQMVEGHPAAIMSLSLDKQNEELRRALNAKIQENNGLMQRIEKLSGENSQMRSMLEEQVKRRSQLIENSVSPQKQLREQSFGPLDGKKHQYDFMKASQGKRDTLSSKPELSMQKTSISRGSAQDSRLNFLRELWELKEQDQSLRQKTIQLLKLK